MLRQVKKYFRAEVILMIPCIIFTVYLLYRMISNMMAGLSFPNEFREAVNIELTRSILRGENPYSLSLANSRPPGPCYLYPFVYCYLVAFLYRIFPLDLVLMHYLVTLLSMVLSAVLLSLMLRRQTGSIAAAFIAFPLMLMCHWRYGYIGAVPDSLGLFLFILAIYLASLGKYRGKVLLSAFLTVLLFFVKQYFILAAGVLGLYYLWVSVKDTVKYVAFSAALTIVCAVLTTIAFPTYWTYAFYLLKGTEVYFSAEQFCYMLEQYVYVGVIFALLLLPVLVRMLYMLFCKSKRKSLKELFCYKGFDRPLIHVKTAPGRYLYWCAFFVCGAGLLYFGLNNGAYLTYYLQLFCPAVIFLGLSVWEENVLNNKEFFKGVERHGKKARAACWCLYAAAAALTLFLGYRKLPFHVLNEQDLEEWALAERYLDEYGEGGVYHSATTAYYAFDHGQYVYDTGHVNITRESNYEIWKKSESDQKLFPYAGVIYENHGLLHEELREQAVRGEFSLITYVDGLDIVFTPKLLSRRYRLLDTVSLQVGNMEYDTQFWIPLSGDGAAAGGEQAGEEE